MVSWCQFSRMWRKISTISGEETLFFFALVRRASLESLLLKNVFKGLSTINIHMFRDSRLDLSPLDVKKPRVITSNSSSLLQVNKGWLTRSDGSQSCVALSFPFFLSSSLSPPLSLADDSGCVHEIFNYDWLAGGQCLANGVRLKGPWKALHNTGERGKDSSRFNEEKRSRKKGAKEEGGEDESTKEQKKLN